MVANWVQLHTVCRYFSTVFVPCRCHTSKHSMSTEWEALCWACGWCWVALQFHKNGGMARLGMPCVGMPGMFWHTCTDGLCSWVQNCTCVLLRVPLAAASESTSPNLRAHCTRMYCWIAFKLSYSSGAALAIKFGNLLMLNQHSLFRGQLRYMVSLCPAAVVLCTSDCSVQRVLLLWFRKHLQVEPHWALVLLHSLWKQFSFEVKGLAAARWRPWRQVSAWWLLHGQELSLHTGTWLAVPCN